MSQAPTSDQQRAAIDSGEAGDKVAFADPAAAPLGTDAEAGGHPPTAQELRMEQPAFTEPAARPRDLSPAVLGYVGAIVVLVVAVVLIAIFRS
ncbi:MAG TPA: hypothetical protein VHC18_27135 [Amycolatopsis sp.]|jgi:hypothetical protein|nr:hypothetical protein [Amycolatopsis sp.]